MQHVSDWMTPGPITVEVTASALEALEEMLGRGLRHLPVVASGQLVGILSREDLRAALPLALTPPLSPEQRREALEYRVGDIMSHAPVTTAPDTRLALAAGALTKHRVGCLPVVDDAGKLVGILTTTDALRALVRLLDGAPPAGAAEGPLDQLMRSLRDERGRMLEDVRAREATERELSTAAYDEPSDAADQGSALEQAQLQGFLVDLSARRLQEIDRALERHERGELGLCSGCQRPIPLARLRILPGTEYCVACARRERFVSHSGRL